MTDGLLVAFETSTRRPTVAVARAGDPPLVATLDGERAHARDLLPALERLLARIGATVAAVEGLAVGVGPGSFTGLRVGVATALGLERALGLPTVAVPSMAAAVLGALADGEIGGQLLDARGGRLYLGAFRREGERAVATIDACAPRPAELPALLAADGWRGARRALLFVDDAARPHAARALAARDVLPSLRDGVEPDAAGVLRLARARLAEGDADPPGSVRPLYLARFGE